MLNKLSKAEISVEKSTGMQSLRHRSYDISRLRCMIIEKNDYILDMERGVLRTMGVRTLDEARHPFEAFDRFVIKPADIVFCDWAPGMDGLEFLKLVRRDPETPNPFVPVIMVTAFTRRSHVIRARDAGMTEYLAKPISATLLYSRIRSVIETHRAFIKAGLYFGPNRRRHAAKWEGPERRTRSPKTVSDRLARPLGRAPAPERPPKRAANANAPLGVDARTG